MISPRKSDYTPLIEALLILIIAAVTYLPSLSQATIYRDDWYYTMDRLIGGPGTFQQMFSIDRPARGPLFETYYQLFGVNPFPYHMSSFVWRVLGGLAALWLFRLLWPAQRKVAFFMALLFTLYPGYQRWMEGFENQPRILSSFLEVLSIVLTLKAIQTTRKASKIAAWAGSIISGWAYIALVDFAIGMEIFRILCVFVLIQHDQPALSFIKKSISTLRAWAIAALIPVGFLGWRLFIFQNERPATDVGLQLGALFNSPLSTGIWWLIRLFQSTMNVAVLAWGAPLFENLFGLRLVNLLTGVLAACIVVFIPLFANFLMDKNENKNLTGSGENLHPHELDADCNSWQKEAIWIGIIGVVVGVTPIILANRYVSFGSYSHYALPASLASAVATGGLIFSVQSRRIQVSVMSLIVLLAVLTHFSVSSQILYEEKVIQNFWQQVVWRAPGIKAGTTLAVNYPSISYAEDVDAVAGPANFLYFPGQTDQIPVTYQLVALPQMNYTTKNVIAGGEKPYGYRTHIGTINFNNILVISQPSEGSCVHIINQQWPRYTDQDLDQTLMIGQYSKIENVMTDAPAPQPAEFIFGPKPAHGWCYYYQRAEMALQKQDWKQIVKLASEVNDQSLHPTDRIEWAPFLQAYAYLGNEQAFKETATKIDSSPFVRLQACNMLIKMQAMGYSFTPQIQALMDEKLCRGHSKANPLVTPVDISAP